jgi:hypothetical protein
VVGGSSLGTVGEVSPRPIYPACGSSDIGARLLEVAGHYSACPDNHIGSNVNVREHLASHPEETIVSDMDSSRKRGPRANMDAVTEHAFMIDRSRRVQNCGFAELGPRAHKGKG